MTMSVSPPRRAVFVAVGLVWVLIGVVWWLGSRDDAPTETPDPDEVAVTTTSPAVSTTEVDEDTTESSSVSSTEPPPLGPVFGGELGGSLVVVTRGADLRLDLDTGELVFGQERLVTPVLDSLRLSANEVVSLHGLGQLSVLDVNSLKRSPVVTLDFGGAPGRLVGRSGPSSVWVAEERRESVMLGGESVTRVWEVDTSGSVTREIELPGILDVEHARGRILYVRGPDALWSYDTDDDQFAVVRGSIILVRENVVMRSECDLTRCALVVDRDDGSEEVSHVTSSEAHLLARDEAAILVSTDASQIAIHLYESSELTVIDLIDGGRRVVAFGHQDLVDHALWIQGTPWLVAGDGQIGRQLVATNLASGETIEIPLWGIERLLPGQSEDVGLVIHVPD